MKVFVDGVATIGAFGTWRGWEEHRWVQLNIFPASQCLVGVENEKMIVNGTKYGVINC